MEAAEIPQEWTPEARSKLYASELHRRFVHVQALTADRSLRAIVMKHYQSSAEGCIDWISDFAMTYDPRNKDPVPRIFPFVMFPRQKQFIRYLYECWANGENGLCEKARDMGASWLCVYFSVWLWRFHPGSAIGWGSRKADLVDEKDDMKAVFPKIRLQIQWLPRWMRPKGFDMSKHGTFMKIVNPENGSTITGEAGDNIGRGGRTSIYFKDESAHYEHPEAIEAALGDNTDVQIDISSVNGTNNVFYNRRMAGQVWYPDMPAPIEKGMVRVFIFDWREHPGKTQQWYDLKRARAEREGLYYIFAQETERDYMSAIENIIISPLWFESAIDAHIHLAHLGAFDDGLTVCAHDVADGGRDKNADLVLKAVTVIHCDDWGGEAGEGANPCIQTCIDHKVDEMYYDSVGVGSGFKTAVNQLKVQGQVPPRLRIFPWNGGEKVLQPDDNIDPGDPESPLNKDHYANLKAQSYGRLRVRFYKTYRARKYNEVYDPSELISVDSRMPKVQELKRQVSQPVSKRDTKGKMLVDKMPDGAWSPNMADVLAMATNPTRELSILDVL